MLGTPSLAQDGFPRTTVKTGWRVTWSAISSRSLGAAGMQVLAFGLCGVGLWRHIHHYWPYLSDDSLISLRYAVRLASGRGLTWTDGERVEGYTNLLWVLLNAPAVWLGVDPIRSARVLGIVGMAIAIAAVSWSPVKGRWLRGPGADIFHAVTDALGKVAIIAEDLGDFDEESRAGVDALQEEFGYPGMKVVQFAFGAGPEDPFLPHNYSSPDWVVYTGTHDNDTVLGWYEESSTEQERDYARKYLGTDGSDIAWDMIRLAWASTACTAMTTTQDLLELGHHARMNTPSTLGPPNWCWRLLSGMLTDDIAERLLTLTAIYGRRP